VYGAGRVPRCQISSISKSNRQCILVDDLHALSGYDSTGVKDSEAWCVWERSLKVPFIHLLSPLSLASSLLMAIFCNSSFELVDTQRNYYPYPYPLISLYLWVVLRRRLNIFPFIYILFVLYTKIPKNLYNSLFSTYSR